MSFRAIRYEPCVDDQLKELGLTHQRLDEIIGIASDLLCQHPEMFPVIVGTKLSFCRTNEFVGIVFPNIPSLAIYFRYDRHTVSIISIEETTIESYGC
jgi:hypothetical protein